MFTAYFKMKKLPFSEWTPTEGIFQDDRIEEGLSRLTYFTQNGAIALLTGESGVGKSSLIKLFLSKLSRNQYAPLYVHLTNVSSSSLLNLVVNAQGEVPKRGKERVLLQILEKAHRLEKTSLLIVDEAQFLESDALTDLRLLVSSALDDAPPLKLLISGQPEIRKQLRRSRHEPLMERISLRYHIPPLTRTQTAEYIDYQLRWAGASEKIFGPEVKETIFEYTRGIPRQVNNLATSCLLNACARKSQKVTEALLTDTLAEYQLA